MAALGDDPGDQVQSELILKLGHQALCDVDDVHDSSGSLHLAGTAMSTAPRWLGLRPAKVVQRGELW